MAKKEKKVAPKEQKKIKTVQKKDPKNSARWISLYKRADKNELEWVYCSNCKQNLIKSLADSLSDCPFCNHTIIKEE